MELAVNSLVGMAKILRCASKLRPDVYKRQALAGTLDENGAGNIDAPEAGFYMMEVDLTAMTYKHTLISVSYTHLDVYKRQELNTVLLLLPTKSLWELHSLLITKQRPIFCSIP